MHEWKQDEPGAAKYMMITILSCVGVLFCVGAFVWVVYNFGRNGGMMFLALVGVVGIVVILQVLDGIQTNRVLQAAADMTASAMGAQQMQGRAAAEQWRAIGADNRLAAQELRQIAATDRQLTTTKPAELAPWEVDDIDEGSFFHIE